MAIDISNETVALAVKERTRQITIFTPTAADPEICIYRERVWLDQNGAVFRSLDLPCVETSLSKIADTKFGDKTGAELAALISAAADAMAAASSSDRVVG
jgi:hypothetical protein